MERDHRQEMCALMNRTVDRSAGARHPTEERRSCELRSSKPPPVFSAPTLIGLSFPQSLMVDCPVALWNLFLVYFANKHKGFI